jgi:hypothetical protein
VVGLGAVAAALGLLMLLANPVGPTRHASGEGPLSTAGEPWSMGLDPAHEDRWTLGIYLCATDAGSPPVIASVTPVRSVGTYQFLGGLIREFVAGDAHTPIISIAGYPPNVPDRLREVAGFVVTASCSPEGGSATYTEALLGIGRDGEGGGGWLGEEIAYHVGGRQYTLALDYTMLVCGPAVPEGYC